MVFAVVVVDGLVAVVVVVEVRRNTSLPNTLLDEREIHVDHFVTRTNVSNMTIASEVVRVVMVVIVCKKAFTDGDV